MVVIVFVIIEKFVEIKGQKFICLVNLCVFKVFDVIVNIGGLVSKINYEYIDEQIVKIFGVFEVEMMKL